MEKAFVSVGLYREHLVSYKVESSDGVHFIATLLRYKGNHSMMPPITILLLRFGNHWKSDTDKELMAFLVNDSTEWLRKENKSRNKKAKHHSPIDNTAFAGGMQEIIYKS